MNILLLEDNAEQRNYIRHILLTEYDDVAVYECATLAEAKKHCAGVPIGLMLLDIEVPDGSGLAFATDLREKTGYASTPIFFITDYAELELPAYRNAACYGFLNKPIVQEELTLLLSRFLNVKQDDSFSVPDPKDSFVRYRVQKRDILYVESRGHKLCMQLSTGASYEWYGSLTSLEEEWKGDSFVRTHRSFLVNTRHMASIEKTSRTSWTIHFSDSDQVAFIGKTYFLSFQNYKTITEPNR